MLFRPKKTDLSPNWPHQHSRADNLGNRGGRTMNLRCEPCRKSFSRKDILLRHDRLIHGNASTNTTGRRSSCQNCVRQKLKCSRTLPCASCVARNIDCSFQLSRINEQRASPKCRDAPHEIDGARRPSGSESPLADGVYSHEQLQSSAPSASSLRSHSNGGRNKDCPIRLTAPMNSQISSGEHPASVSDDQCPTAQFAMFSNESYFLSPPLELLSQDLMPDDERLREMQQDDGLIPELPDDGGDASIDTNSFEWDSFPPLGLGTDWLSWHVNPSANDAILEAPNEVWPQSELSHQIPPCPSAVQRLSLVEMMCSDAGSPALITQPNFQNLNQASKFPVQERSPASTSISIPQTSLLESLTAILSSQTLPEDFASEPYTIGRLHLDKLINVYFTDFHANLPVIHRPTWDTSKAPAALVASMACLGSTSYHKQKGSDAVSSLLADLCLRHLREMVCIIFHIRRRWVTLSRCSIAKELPAMKTSNLRVLRCFIKSTAWVQQCRHFMTAQMNSVRY